MKPSLASLLLAALALWPMAVQAAPPAVLEFHGVALGTSLDDWRQKPFADPSHPGVTQACSRSSGPPAATVCQYIGRYGAYTVAESFPLFGRYQAKGVKYRFVSGRLSEIDFSTSVEAFGQLMKRLKTRYGAPRQTVRDTASYRRGIHLPRTRVRWRLPAGMVELVDPSQDPGLLTVRLVSAEGATRSVS